MPATQLSFAEFALAQQAATVCPPPVQQAALAVVAHPLAVDGGECSNLDAASCDSLVRSAVGTCDSHDGSISLGGFVLLALSNLGRCLLLGSTSDRIDTYCRLRNHAMVAIGAGC